MRLTFLVLLTTGCPSPSPVWYETCGDPVCSGYTEPTDLAVCGSQAVGAACSPEGELCAIPDDPCNVRLLCTTEDPTQGEGGCPISRASAKSAIRYVEDRERAELARQLAEIRLATYHYTADPKATPRLGFVIEDQPPAATVFPHGERVDLYGTTSLAIAAIQEHQATIAAQRAELAALAAEVSRLSTELAALRASPSECR